MPWSTIASTDVLNELTPVEQNTLQSIQGGSTNLPAIVTKVIKKIRSMIKAGGNPLDGSSLVTIPDSLVEEAISISRWKWILSFPALKFLATKERKDANDAAEARLKDIASQDPHRERTEMPAVPDTGVTSQQEPSFGCRHRQFTNKSQDG